MCALVLNLTFEHGRPELGDQVANQSKQRGYYLARLKGVAS
jgi:hypothetical protein